MRAQVEREERQIEERERERAHELEMARLVANNHEMRRETEGNTFVYKAKGIIPVFREEDPDEFFSMFEEVATTMGWEQEKWPILIPGW